MNYLHCVCFVTVLHFFILLLSSHLLSRTARIMKSRTSLLYAQTRLARQDTIKRDSSINVYFFPSSMNCQSTIPLPSSSMDFPAHDAFLVIDPSTIYGVYYRSEYPLSHALKLFEESASWPLRWCYLRGCGRWVLA
jgi:hypothetical protein